MKSSVVLFVCVPFDSKESSRAARSGVWFFRAVARSRVLWCEGKIKLLGKRISHTSRTASICLDGSVVLEGRRTFILCMYIFSELLLDLFTPKLRKSCVHSSLENETFPQSSPSAIKTQLIFGCVRWKTTRASSSRSQTLFRMKILEQTADVYDPQTLRAAHAARHPSFRR